jgi:hypothetical protein
MIALNKFYLLLVLLLVICSSSRANKREAILQLENLLDQKISGIITRVDPDAIVIVSLVEKKMPKASRLPMTAFTVKDIKSLENETPIDIQSASIHIYSHQTSLPKATTELISTLISKLGAKPEWTFTKLPEELTLRSNVTVIPPDVITDTKKPSVEASTSDFTPAIARLEKTLAYLLVCAGILGSLLFILYLYINQTQVKNLVSVLTLGFHNLKNQAVESAPMPVAETVTPMQLENPASPNSAANPRDLSDFSNESLTALISDCYWCEKDGQAAFLWTLLSTTQKTELMKSLPFMKEYGEYLLTSTPHPEGLEQDPYYLSPLMIQHLNNVTLSALVKKYPQLFNALSFSRKQALDLSPLERLQLSQSELPKGSLPSFETVSASHDRKLNKSIHISFRSEDEELEILKQRNLSTEIKAQIPSLGWLFEVPPEKIKDIFSTFTASELATAWIGPAPVLQKLSKLLPSKKWELMQSHLLTARPSRHSDTFKRIHQLAITYRDANETGEWLNAA